MTTRQSLVVQGMHAAIVLSAIVAVTALGINGTLDGQSVVAVLAAAIGFAGASGSQIGTLAQAVNGKATMSNESLADREATLRTAMVAAAATPAHVMTAVEPEDVEPEDRG